MNVLVFGSCNRLHAGDNRLRSVLARLIDPDDLTFVPYEFKLPPRYTRFFDWIILHGGSPFSLRRKFRRNLKRCIKEHPGKVLVLGLQVDRGFHRRFAARTVTASKFFSVSDKRSAELLGNDPRVYVCPDIRWCCPLDAIFPDDQRPTVDVAVNLTLSGQSPLDTDQWINQLASYSLAPFPMSARDGPDLAALRRSFTKVPAECPLDPLRSCRVLLASEYSAVLFALQVRKPFVAINTGDDVNRLVDDAGFDDCLLQPADHHRVSRKIAHVLENYPAMLRRIDHYAYLQSRAADELLLRLSDTMGIDNGLTAPRSRPRFRRR